MKKICFIVLLIAVQICSAQSPDWKQSSKWMLIDIHDDNAFSYSMDTLSHFKSVRLDDAVLHDLLQRAVAWPKGKTAMWMGLLVTRCVFADGTARKIDVSVYGGFFYVEALQAYFEIADADKAAWTKYFHDAMEKLSADPAKKVSR